MGREMALLLAREGAKVGLADVASEAALEAVKKEVEAIAGAGSAFTAFTDVSNPEHVTAWVEGTVNAHGKLDGTSRTAQLTAGKRD